MKRIKVSAKIIQKGNMIQKLQNVIIFKKNYYQK